jgi:hypothetical protein
MTRRRRSAVIGAALVSGSLAAGMLQGCGDQAPSAVTKPSAKPAVDYFSALIRPSVAPIASSVRAKIRAALRQVNPDVDLQTLRLLRRRRIGRDTIDVYAAVGSRSVCSVTRRTRPRGPTPGSSGCGPAVGADGTPLVHASSSSDTGHTFLLIALVPDRITALRLRFSDATEQHLRVVNNIVVYRGSRRPEVLTYTDQAGKTSRENASPDGR